MSALDLEALLRSNDGPPEDLSDRLERIKVSAGKIWAKQRLEWFTDHSSHRHSRRIVWLLGALIERLQEGARALTPAELYVLLAAAYLHDIGMQDFRVTGSTEESTAREDFTYKDYELIRKRHPERGMELIVRRALQLEPGRDTFRVDIDDELAYLLPIALVSRGHGSAYFESTVSELDGRDDAPGNDRLRGGLLTALLLFADELDLHEDRATFPAEMGRSPLTALHHHVNHYVTLVSVGDGDTTSTRRVHISFAFPEDSAEYQGDVRLYVVGKLSSQAERVNPVLRRETDGLLALDPVMRVRARTETISDVRRELPDAALALLRLDLREQALVGRADLVRALREACGKPAPKIVELSAGATSDLPAVLSWLDALCLAKRLAASHVDLSLGVATETNDMLAAVREDFPRGDEVAGEDADTLAALARDRRGGAGRVLVLESVDRLLPAARRWLASELELIVADAAPLLVVLTRGEGSEPLSDDADVHELGPIPVETLSEYLVSRFGYAPDAARVDAEDKTALSSGAPGPILQQLAAQLNRTWVLDE
ncbi:MAG TPA: HD domain-containing protein [Solirubrobacteraceae bacterium]|nr:HD domain-containing protein [Solirubrobacteraceae bacterium]